MGSPITSDRVALVTGGTAGIGLATARALHADGFNVVVTGRNPKTLAQAEAELPADVVVLRADLRSIADANLVAAELKSRFGRLDLAFLNAGIGRLMPLEAMDEAGYDDHFDTNVKGQLFTLQKVLPLLGTGSSVIFNSSTVSHKGLANLAVYAATKAALLGLVSSLAVELAPRGIRVNAVSPGPVDTPIQSKLGIPVEQLDDMMKGLAARLPMGRIGDADEIAGAIVFLASPAASFITGANFAVDGGFGAV